MVQSSWLDEVSSRYQESGRAGSFTVEEVGRDARAAIQAVRDRWR
jgi:hypothetical protein